MTQTHLGRAVARSWRCRYSRQIGGGGMDHDNPAVETPLDPLEVLRERQKAAAAESQEADAALREVMTDDQVLDGFGIDLRQLDD